MNTRNLVAILLAVGALAIATSLLAQSKAAIPVNGTIYGTFNATFEGKGAWVGHAVVAFGGKPARKASMVDRNVSFSENKDGSIVGAEIITLTFLDGSGTLDIDGRFQGVPAKTPSLFTLHETGTISRGTGKYAKAKGNVKIDGPFLFPDSGMTPGTAPWIAELHGTISGVE